MSVAFDGYGLSITSEVFPPSLTQIEGGDLLNLTFHLNYNGTKIGALYENSSTCHELKNSSLFVNLVITLPIVFDIVSHSNQSSQTGIVTSNISNCSFVPLLKINSSSSVVSNHMPGIKALNFHIFSQNFSWTATLNVRLKLLPSARADSLLNITANVTISNKTMEDDISIASYRTAVPGNLQFELKSTSIPETPGPTLTSEEEITLFASFHIPRITANVKLQVLLPVFRNSTPMKFVSGSVVDLSEGVKPKLLMEGSGPRFIVSPSTAHLFPLTQNVVEFAFGDTVNKGNESFNGTITVEVTGAVDSSRGVYIPESFGNVTCILMYDSPRGSYLTANKTLITLKLGQPLLEFHLEADNSDCCYEGKDMVDIKYEVKNPDFSTAPAWNLTLNISVLSADIELHNFSAFLCGNTSVFNMTSNQSVAETKCRDLYGTHMLTKANAGLQVKLTRSGPDLSNP